MRQDACAANDMGVLIIRPLASGVLATDVQHERMMPAQYVDGYTRDDWHENEVRKARACFDALSTGDAGRLKREKTGSPPCGAIFHSHRTSGLLSWIAHMRTVPSSLVP